MNTTTTYSFENDKMNLSGKTFFLQTSYPILHSLFWFSFELYQNKNICLIRSGDVRLGSYDPVEKKK
jgi:hypothetical protein